MIFLITYYNKRDTVKFLKPSGIKKHPVNSLLHNKKSEKHNNQHGGRSCHYHRSCSYHSLQIGEAEEQQRQRNGGSDVNNGKGQKEIACPPVILIKFKGAKAKYKKINPAYYNIKPTICFNIQHN